MAKAPTPKKPVAEKPATASAPTAPSPAVGATPSEGAGAATAAPEAGAGASAPVDRSASAGGQDTAGAEGGAAANVGGVAAPSIAELVAEFRAAGAELLSAYILLRNAALSGAAEDAAVALDAISELNADLPLGVSALRLKLEASDGELVAIEGKSRDGKPFRRAGHVFGADFQSYLVSRDALERIRADHGIVTRDPA